MRASVHYDRLSAVLAEFAQVLLTDYEVADILDRLCSRVPEVLPVSGAGVVLINRGELLLAHASSHQVGRVEEMQDAMGEGPCRDAVSTRRLVLANDLSHEPRWPEFAAYARQEGLQGVAALPMSARGAIRGVLDIYSERPLRLSPDELHAAQLLADVATSYLLQARDREGRALAEEQLRIQVLHDPLTGLPNRALFLDRLTQALSAARRRPSSLAVLFVDIDRFKEINDSYGHAAGDRLLVEVGNRLKAALRPGDTIARLAGDEFAILCMDLHTVDREDEVAAIAQRLLDALDAPIRISGDDVLVRASLGAAHGQVRDTAELLLHDSDLAMYVAKRAGGHAYSLSSRMTVASPTRMKRQAALSAAVQHGDLRLAHQPIIHLATGERVSAEALLRWRRSDGELLPPASFLPLAEDTGLITRVGEWVLRHGCRHLAEIQARGPTSPYFQLAVNVSPRELRQPAFVAMTRGALTASGADPRGLALEITESTLIDDIENTMAIFDELKEIGVLLAIDDFGTGYASLSYLQRLPVDIVKIDQRFVAEVGSDTRDTAIVRHLVDLAHDLGLIVVAEGIENDRQYEQLRKLGCDLGQGYLLGVPELASTI